MSTSAGVIDELAAVEASLAGGEATVRMDDTKVAEASKDDPAEVAKDGFEALMAGKDRVVAASAKNKAKVAAGKLLPETARARLQAVQVKPDQDD